MKRTSGTSLVAVIVVVVMVSALGAGLVTMTGDMGRQTPQLLDAAKSFYAAESGVALANKKQAATAGPVAFNGATWQTAKAGNVYTTTVTVGGTVVRVLSSTVDPPGGGQSGGPLDESATAATATTSRFTDPNAGTIKGGDKKLVMKVINETSNDLVITDFAVSSTGSQPKVKKLKFRTAANGWDDQKVWDYGSGVSLPTGKIALDQGGPNDYTVPANSYIIVDELEFKDDVDPYTDFTVTFYFNDGSQSDVTFTILAPATTSAPLDEAASQATATTGSFSDPNAGTVSGDNKKIVMKLINESSENLVIESFTLSADGAQPKLKKLELSTPGNGWDKEKVWEQGSGVSLPTGTLTLDDGDPVEDYVIPAGGYIIVEKLEFKDDLNAGSFTLTVNFLGGVSSTLTFPINP